MSGLIADQLPWTAGTGVNIYLISLPGLEARRRLRLGQTSSETLSADKTLARGTDSEIQLLDPDGARRVVTLYATPAADDLLIIKNTGSTVNVTGKLVITGGGGGTIIELMEGDRVWLVYDGSSWVQL